MKYCVNCGAQIDDKAEICPKCGVRQPTFALKPKERDRIVASLLAIFLGNFGIHKFYLGKIGQGIVYLLFCWTFIPAIISLIEGIRYLFMSEEDFDRIYNYSVF
jgi:TM2 domain-containing membrane protein YozV